MKPSCLGRRLQAALIANYYIERCAGLGCSNFSQIASVSGSTLTYTDTTISSGTVYNYRVRAENSSGTLQPLFQCPGAQPDSTARCFQLHRDSSQNADLERLGGKWRLDQPVLYREMYWTWLLQLFPDCDYFEHVLHGHFCRGGVRPTITA